MCRKKGFVICSLTSEYVQCACYVAHAIGSVLRVWIVKLCLSVCRIWCINNLSPLYRLFPT